MAIGVQVIILRFKYNTTVLYQELNSGLLETEENWVIGLDPVNALFGQSYLTLHGVHIVQIRIMVQLADISFSCFHWFCLLLLERFAAGIALKDRNFPFFAFSGFLFLFAFERDLRQ